MIASEKHNANIYSNFCQWIIAFHCSNDLHTILSTGVPRPVCFQRRKHTAAPCPAADPRLVRTIKQKNFKKRILFKILYFELSYKIYLVSRFDIFKLFHFYLRQMLKRLFIICVQESRDLEVTFNIGYSIVELETLAV